MARDIAGRVDPGRTATQRLAGHERFGTWCARPSRRPTFLGRPRLLDRVLAGLGRYNAVYAEEANVRTCAAFHVGEVRHVPVSDATTHAFRLVEAPEAKNT
jgi:hypothetical protein